MKRFIFCCLGFCHFALSYGQDPGNAVASLQDVPDSSLQAAEAPSKNRLTPKVYSTSFKNDAPLIAAGVGLTYLGVSIINNKKNLTTAEVEAKTKSDIPFFDRSSAGWYSRKIDRDSYIPFQFSFTTPVIMLLINKNERKNAVNVLVMYTETMGVTGALFTMAAGLVQRSRPLVYGTKAPIDLRMSAKSQRAFFAGHTAASAAATFYAAKVFHDLNPGSGARPYVWAIAAAIPATVGYMRYKAGMHFISDNILGYVIGAASGILVPQLHKSKIKNITLAPEAGYNYKGLALAYHF